MQIRFHLDESVNHAIAHGLKLRDIDATTSTAAGLINATDEEQLAFADNEKRVLITHDDDFLRLHAEGFRHAGIAYAHPENRTIGQVVLSLANPHREKTQEEVTGHVIFV